MLTTRCQKVLAMKADGHEFTEFELMSTCYDSRLVYKLKCVLFHSFLIRSNTRTRREG